MKRTMIGTTKPLAPADASRRPPRPPPGCEVP
jgi:hypothetical protein